MIFIFNDQFICMLKKPELIKIYVYEYWRGWVYAKGSRDVILALSPNTNNCGTIM